MNFKPTFQAKINSFIGAVSAEISHGNLIVRYSDGTADDLGKISAYEIAVAHGYVGTEEEWSRLQMESATQASNAAAFAESAEAAQEGANAVLCVVQEKGEEISSLAEEVAQSANKAETAASRAEAIAAGFAENAKAISDAKDGVNILTRLIQLYFGDFGATWTHRLVKRQMSDDIVVETWVNAVDWVNTNGE